MTSKEDSTSTMDDWRGSRSSGEASTDAGLVLLYASDSSALPPVFPLGRPVVLAGREPGGATIVIPQRAVSRVHARFARDDHGDWTVTDLDSRNGVFVDGWRIRTAPLQEDAVVRIGDAIFKFVASEASAFAHYRLDGTVADGARVTALGGAVGGLRLARISAEVDSIAEADLPVIVHGETGSGKEMVARAIHAKSGRAGPFRAVNCASIPANLVESELFGYKRGAFTGATQDHVGLIRSAHGGTLLLDEIGDMPLEAQAKLLRTLETREVVPVGAVSGIPVDVRIVAATHRDLPGLVDEGAFRADLYARLAGYSLALPPLRARKEDLYPLVRYWLRECGHANHPIDFGFMVALCHHDWPYSVRELASAVRRAVALAGDQPIEARHLPSSILVPMEEYGRVATSPKQEARAPGTEARPPSRGPRPTPETLAALLEEHRGNVSAVARALGKDRGLVDRWIRASSLDPERYR